MEAITPISCPLLAMISGECATPSTRHTCGRRKIFALGVLSQLLIICQQDSFNSILLISSSSFQNGETKANIAISTVRANDARIFPPYHSSDSSG